MFFLPLLVLGFLVCFFFVRFFFYLFIFAVRQSNKLDAKPIYGPSIIIKTRQKKRTDRRAKKKMFAKRGIIILYSIVDVVAVAVVADAVVVVGSGNVANLPFHFIFIGVHPFEIKSRENAIHLRLLGLGLVALEDVKGCTAERGGGVAGWIGLFVGRSFRSLTLTTSAA